MTDLFVWIESTAFATWVRESPSQFAYTGMLFLHGAGLALSVGISLVIVLRVLGLVPALPLPAIPRLFPLLWTGFWVNGFSGGALLASSMTGEMDNTVFQIKLAFVVLAAVTMRKIQRALGPTPSDVSTSRALSAAALVFWVAAITFGRFVAYPALLGLN